MAYAICAYWQAKARRARQVHQMTTLNELCESIEAQAKERGDEIVHVQAGEPIESKPGRLVVVEIPSAE